MGLTDAVGRIAEGVAKAFIPKRYRVRMRNYLLVDQWAVELIERERFLNHAFRALAFNGISGDYVEFGCSGGHTFGFAYNQAKFNGHGAHFWAFDSFAGLPEGESKKDDHPVWQKGALNTGIDEFHDICRGNGVPREAYTTVPGFYRETLDNAQEADQPRDIGLAYIDCDMYSSTISVLNYLLPRLKHGMILAFDDYFCWSPTQVSGERLAAKEVFEGHETWNLLPYLTFNWGGMSFIVEDRKMLEPS